MIQHRVLHLITDTGARGAQLFARRLAKRLEGELFENHICALREARRDGTVVPDNEVMVLRPVSGRLERSLPLNPWTVFGLRGVLQRLRPSIVVGHGSTTLRYAALARLFERNAVSLYMNIGMPSFWVNSPAKVALNRLLISRIDTTISVCRAAAEDFRRVYGVPSDRVAVIPNAVELAEFATEPLTTARETVRSELGVAAHSVTLITVGNLSWEKNQADVLDGVAALKASGIPIHLLLVGDGPLRGALGRQAAEQGITDCVHFLGVRNDVPRLLAAADLFVLPSRTEGMPAVLIEAGLAGLPTIAYDVGGVSEVIVHEETGVLVPFNARAAMAEAIRRLAMDAALRVQMGETAVQHCRERFGMAQSAQAFEDLFLQVLDANRKSTNGHA